MNCEAARELIEKNPNATAAPQELTEHLSTCPQCAQIKADIDTLAKWYALIKDEDAPEEFSQSWREAIKRPRRTRPLPYRLMAYAAAAIAVLSVIGMASRIFAPVNYTAQKSSEFHVAGSVAGEPAAREGSALFGGQDTVSATAAPIPMPEAAMDSAPAAGAPEMPQAAPFAEEESSFDAESGPGDSAPAPKASILTEKELRRASSSIIPAYEIALSAQDHTALMEYISQLRENNPDGDLRYHQQTDSAGRVNFFQMNCTTSELSNLNDWLNARDLKYEVYMPPETWDTEFVSFVLTEIPAATP